MSYSKSRVVALMLHEQTGGFTHRTYVEAGDLTQTALAAAQIIDLFDREPGDVIVKAAAYVEAPFENTDDPNFNDTKVIFGDAGDTDRLLAEFQVNKNGTVNYDVATPGGALPFSFSTAGSLQMTIAAMEGKALRDINSGKLWVFIEKTNSRLLAH